MSSTSTPATNESTTSELTCEEVFPDSVFVIRGLLSAEECAELVEKASSAGFESAALANADDSPGQAEGG